MQPKQFFFTIATINITECHPTYYPKNQFFIDIINILNQIENINTKSHAHNRNIHTKSIGSNNKIFVKLDNSEAGKCRPQIRKLKCLFTIMFKTFINRRGYGNFKICRYPTNPDGYAIWTTCQFSVFSAFRNLITILSETFKYRGVPGNFAKCRHPINPDGYAILTTC